MSFVCEVILRAAQNSFVDRFYTKVILKTLVKRLKGRDYEMEKKVS